MEELSGLLTKLKMEHLEAQLPSLCEQAAARELDYQSFLAEALRTEWQGRFRRGVEARLRTSRFPWIKTLEQFDFDFQPSLDRRVVRELAGLSFIERAENVVVLGPPGVGKTHLSVAFLKNSTKKRRYPTNRFTQTATGAGSGTASVNPNLAAFFRK